jgi:hypothetical protein
LCLSQGKIYEITDSVTRLNILHTFYAMLFFCGHIIHQPLLSINFISASHILWSCHTQWICFSKVLTWQTMNDLSQYRYFFPFSLKLVSRFDIHECLPLCIFKNTSDFQKFITIIFFFKVHTRSYIVETFVPTRFEFISASFSFMVCNQKFFFPLNFLYFSCIWRRRCACLWMEGRGGGAIIMT